MKANWVGIAWTIIFIVSSLFSFIYTDITDVQAYSFMAGISLVVFIKEGWVK